MTRKMFNIAWNGASNALRTFGRWFTNVVLARTVTDSEFGAISFVLGVINVLAALFSFGSELFLQKEVSKNLKEGELELLKSIRFSIAIFCFTSILIGVLTYASITSFSLLELLLCNTLGLLLAINYSCYGYYRGKKEFQRLFGVHLIYIFFTLLLGVSLDRNAWDFQLSIGNVFAYLVLLQAIITCSFWFFAGPKKTLFGINAKVISRRFSFGFHQIQSAIFSNITVLLLAGLLTFGQLAEFRALYLIVLPLGLLPQAFAQVHLNVLIEKYETGTFRYFPFYRFMIYCIGAVSLLCGVLVLLDEQIVLALYGQHSHYENNIVLVRFFCLGVCFRVVSANFGVLLTATENQRVRTTTTLLSLLAGIGCMGVLAMKYGLFGAALGYAINAALLALLSIIASSVWVKRKL